MQKVGMEIGMVELYLTYLDDDEDKKLFEKIYLENREKMYSVAKNVTRNNDAAEDVVHDVFLSIARRNWSVVKGIENDKALTNYLLKSSKNRAINYIQHSKFEVNETEEVLENMADSISYDDLFDEISKRDDYMTVVEILNKLDDRYKYPLYYHIVLEMSVKETAKQLERNEETIKKQLTRGKKMLQDILRQEGVVSYGIK